MSTGVKVGHRGGTARQLACYFGALIAVYAAALAVFWPPEGEEPNAALLMVLAYTPLVGALAARFLGGGRIQWGRPNRWILLALIPTVAVLGVYLLGAAVGWDTENSSVLRNALLAAPATILLASLSASVGEGRAGAASCGRCCASGGASSPPA